MQETTLLRLEQISKSFPGVKALKQIDLSIERGEIHALLGENGAGKSTLIKILCGFQKPDKGSMWCKGQTYEPKSVDDARVHGVDTVFQDLALIDELTVYQNLFLKRERLRSPLPFVDNRRMKREEPCHAEPSGGLGVLDGAIH